MFLRFAHQLGGGAYQKSPVVWCSIRTASPAFEVDGISGALIADSTDAEAIGDEHRMKRLEKCGVQRRFVFI